jgi:hypothetical protein
MPDAFHPYDAGYELAIRAIRVWILGLGISKLGRYSKPGLEVKL